MEERNRQKKLVRKETILIVLIGVVCALAFAAGLFYALRHVVNEAYNLGYRHEYYFDRSATTRMFPKGPETYVPYYNTGNNDYQNGRYKEARDNYLQALESDPPHDIENLKEGEQEVECKIRINLALSILAMIDFENLHTNDREAVDKVVEQLLIAREVLTAENCADFDDPYGHDADAEQLKKEIDDILRRLDRQPPTGGGGGDDDNQDQNQNEGDDGEDDISRRERELEEKLKDEMGDAKERQIESERERERERNGGYGYEYDDEVQSW